MSPPKEEPQAVAALGFGKNQDNPAIFSERTGACKPCCAFRPAALKDSGSSLLADWSASHMWGRWLVDDPLCLGRTFVIGRRPFTRTCWAVVDDFGGLVEVTP